MWWWANIYPISIYFIFSRSLISYRFLSNFRRAGVSSSEVKYDTFRNGDKGDDDTRRMRHPHDVTLPPLRPCMGAISFLVSAQYHCVIVYSLVATGYCPAALYHGLRLTTSVIRHSYGLWVRLCHALSAFWGLSCPLCCHVAFLAFALPYLGFTLA